MAEKTFISQFTTAKTASSFLIPSTTFTSIVHKHGWSFVVFIDANDRLKVGRYDGTTFEDYFVDTNPDWTIANDNHYMPTIGIDRDGYLHVTAHMHGYPNATNDLTLPDRYKNKLCMYFKSDNPYDVSSFTFYGDNATYCIPGRGFTAVRFETDNNGVLYAHGRVTVHNNIRQGQNGIGLSVYDEITQVWTRKGVIPPTYTNTIGSFTPIREVIFWNDGGTKLPYYTYTGYYNQLFFDSQNRMHFATEFAINGKEFYFDTVAYMMSDDGGDTWKRADGTVITLPVGIPNTWDNTLSYKVGNIVEYSGDHWRSLQDGNVNHTPSEGSWWTSNPVTLPDVLEPSGLEIKNQSTWVSVDINDNPFVEWLDAQGDNRGIFRYWNGSSWSTPVLHVSPHDNNPKIYPNKSKQILINALSINTYVYVTDTLTDEDDSFTMTEQIVAIDKRNLIEEERFFGVAINQTDLEYGYFYIGTPRLIAHAGPNQSTQNSTVILDGLRSYNQDNTISITGYTWQQISGTTVNILNPYSGTTVVNNIYEGSYVFRLTVTDENNTTSIDDVTITMINNTINHPFSIRTILL